VQASAGLTVNVASWDAEQSETLLVSRDGGPAVAQNQWNDHGDDTDVLAGCFLQAGVSRELTESWRVSAFGRYDWVDEVDFRVGPSTGSADLSGWSLGLGFEFKY
jgi:hypothetical protein